ncbi:MAG: hypothetical protein O7B25_07075, partial [Gammaproteobacteria bacterium]|nr:hypothetical protein [Gammaproteobacteria bacterium]
MAGKSSGNRSDVIDQLVSSYLKLPVQILWSEARGLPFPNVFVNARLEFAGVATSWLHLEQVIWHADELRFVPGLPAKIFLQGPSIEMVVGQDEVDRWRERFSLPYRLELADSALIVHTELAGFPLAEFETGLEIVDGWFVLEPKRATVLGVPSYVSSLFRTYLPVPPLSKEMRLVGIEHETGLLRIRFGIDDFDEEITPGLLLRLQKRFLPVAGSADGSPT